MLTIFSIPKPFEGHIGVIQTNAIQSWVRLGPACEVILLGDEEGVAEAALRLGVRHIPEIERNEYGTPLVNSVFDSAQTASNYQLMCYVNADIILMSDFLPAIRLVQKQPSLLIGRRWDIDLKEPVDFNSRDWEAQLQGNIQTRGVLHGSFGIDYFVFPRGFYGDIPPFAIGRTGWDNWLVYRARSLGASVIDATRVITIVHQNHDYSHHLMGKIDVWKGPEAERNRKLVGGNERAFGINHATHILTRQGTKRALSIEHLCYRLSAIPALIPYLRFLSLPLSLPLRALLIWKKLVKYIFRR